MPNVMELKVHHVSMEDSQNTVSIVNLTQYTNMYTLKRCVYMYDLNSITMVSPVSIYFLSLEVHQAGTSAFAPMLLFLSFVNVV